MIDPTDPNYQSGWGGNSWLYEETRPKRRFKLSPYHKGILLGLSTFVIGFVIGWAFL